MSAVTLMRRKPPRTVMSPKWVVSQTICVLVGSNTQPMNSGYYTIAFSTEGSETMASAPEQQLPALAGEAMEARLDYRKASPEGVKAMNALNAFIHHCGLERSL